MKFVWNLHVLLLEIFLIISVRSSPRIHLPDEEFSSNFFNLATEYFDILVFTQQWPNTACFAHQKKGGTSCNLPDHNRWTIHGLWPTEFNTKNPQFCKNGGTFEASALAPLERELKAKWMTIDGRRTHQSFWSYQWKKHGSCSTSLKELDTPLKYFKKALELNDIYNIQDILRKANVVPGRSYSPQAIFNGVNKVLGRRSQVACITNSEKRESYLWEIRVCFDKSLNLVDCKGYATNCPPTRNVIYPDRPPTI
ncbi:ribonuclease Oy-like [Diachasma alloeum]|uniref:ribonuclease Oy-like n=1 Tax=Diachasma alloeum TaxID=454923 RepID=UPI00073817E0|nr:ribonuclease Oy-like [Diachasma alloeum]